MMRMAARGLALGLGALVGLLGLVGCGSDVSDGAGGEGGEGGQGPTPASCDPPADAADFELGTGELCFERVTAGQEVPLYAGPQGGYHLFLAIGCTDCGAQALVMYTIVDPSTGMPLDRTYPDSTTYAMFSGAEWPQSAGLQIGMPGFQWSGDEDPPVPQGTPIQLQVTVRDGAEGTEILHEGALDLVVGAITPWDPCDANPNGPCCGDELCG